MTERDSWFVNFRKRRNGAKFVYWVGGVVAAVFVAGVSANAYVGRFETRTRAHDYRKEHRTDHKELNGKVQDVNTDLHEVRLIQTRIEGRGELVDLRLQWMQKVENHRDRRQRDERVERMERMIERQEKLVKGLEDR
jgi:hypothetical protein